jgi:hypothetical protein
MREISHESVQADVAADRTVCMTIQLTLKDDWEEGDVAS